MRARLLLATLLLARAPSVYADDRVERSGRNAEPRGAAEVDAEDLVAADGGVPDEVIQAARAHFSRGVELYRSASYDAALAEFTRAYESAPSYRILYNLAQIQAQRHDYVASRELFTRYLEDGGDAIVPERHASVQNEIRELERRISWLDVDTRVDGARLYIDDTPRAYLPLEEPLLLNAGIHRLRVEKADHEPAYRTVTLTGGDQLSLTLDPTANLDIDEEIVVLRPALDVPPAPAPDRTAFWLSVAATSAFAGSTVTFAFLTRGADGQLEQRLSQYPAPRNAVEHARQRVRLFASLTDACAVATLLGAGLAGYTYFASSATTPSGEPPARGLSASFGPTTALWWSESF